MFCLAYSAQTLQINKLNPIFTSKTNIPTLKKLKKHHFYEFLPVFALPILTT